MAQAPSKAYQLAAHQTPLLRTRYRTVIAGLRAAKLEARLRAFQDTLREGTFAINTSLSTCLKVLQGGSLLTAYELAASAAGTRSGAAFDRALKKRLGKFYLSRIRAERLLGFRGKARYGYLHVGGEGPRYSGGECCVYFDRSFHASDATCFAGDTITALFDASGTLCLSTPDALARFAIRPQLLRLATVYNEDLVRGDPAEAPLDEAIVQDVLSEKATLIELHVHEPVGADDIRGIRIESQITRSIVQRIRRFRHASLQSRESQQFDPVRIYLALHDLVTARGDISMVGAK